MNELPYAPSVRKARVEIIPLIDVIFFLLATFVLFTLSMSRVTAIETQLPSGGVPVPGDPSVHIQASEPGTYYWKQGAQGAAELISEAELAVRLALYKQTTVNPAVFVRGDSRANFGAAVKVLDEVRKAGIDRVSIETVASPSGK